MKGASTAAATAAAAVAATARRRPHVPPRPRPFRNPRPRAAAGAAEKAKEAAPPRLLNKSLFLTAVGCPRKLLHSALGRERGGDSALLASLADGGRLFELYCRARRYPDGRMAEEEGRNRWAGRGRRRGWLGPAEADGLAERTRSLLLGAAGIDASADASGETVTVFEASVRSGPHYVRADVLQCLPGGRGLRLVEIKARSWDSSFSSSGEDPLRTKKGGIRASYLPYVQDVAYQKMVVQRAYPDMRVEACLLLPDRAARTAEGGVGLRSLVEDLRSGLVEVRERARDAIAGTGDDLSVLVDVTDAADDVLAGPLRGGGGPSFVEAADEWASALANADGSDELRALLGPPPIGGQCRTCEFRPKTDGLGSAPSGFDECWTEGTGMAPNALSAGGGPVVHLWSGAATNIGRYVAEGKYRLGDLTLQDLGFDSDGMELDKKKVAPRKPPEGGGMTRAVRQRHQVMDTAAGAAQRGINRDASYVKETPLYVLDEEYLRTETSRWMYPYHFIDFETANSPIPYFAGQSPYELVAFQFSHHIMQEDGTVEHTSQFLHANPGDCPNERFLHALAESLGGCKGTVFRWGAHENTVLKKLLLGGGGADASKVLEPLLSGGSRAMVDLMRVATLGYYVAGSDASSSIKRLLLPTLRASTKLEDDFGKPSYSSQNFSNMQWFQRDKETGEIRDPYDILKNQEAASGAIADGGAALAAYDVLQNRSTSAAERSGIESSLLRYCEVDTLAMAMIAKAWQDFLQD